MFQESQNKEYLELCIDRAKNVELTWVAQFLDIILDSVDSKSQLRLNDIGCNLGQFWKGLKKTGGGAIFNISVMIPKKFTLKKQRKYFQKYLKSCLSLILLRKNHLSVISLCVLLCLSI